jgi:ribosome maturation factor RimP
LGVALQDVIAQTVTGLGYDCVEVERTSGGLLRVTIDWPYAVNGGDKPITVEDCERVTRQLQFSLEVDGVDYRRLEVGSPGIDRLLRSETDLVRFTGETVDITLRSPIGTASGDVTANRKKFRGVLEKADSGWQIVWREDPKPPKPGAKRSAKALAALPVHALGFTLDELREARLAPIVDFKGKRPKDLIL